MGDQLRHKGMFINKKVLNKKMKIVNSLRKILNDKKARISKDKRVIDKLVKFFKEKL